MVFLVCLLFSLMGTIQGQNPITIDQQIQNAEIKLAELKSSNEPGVKAQGNQLEQLIQGSNPTLLIYNGEFFSFGGDKPVILDVHPKSLDFVYTDRPDYKNIQLIRIKLESPSDLSIILELDQLSHFQNLAFVYFLATFELCPENPEDTQCQSGIINKLISTSGQKSSMPVLFQVSLRM